MADENTFNADDTVTIYVPKDDKKVADDPLRFNVNGHKTVIKLATDVTIPRYFLPALTDAGIPFRLGAGSAGAEGGALEGSGAATLVESTSIKSNLPHHDAAREGKPLGEEGDTGLGNEDEVDADKQNNDDDLVAGTVADVTAKLDGADAAAIDQIEAAEKDREQPRSGVLSAIEKARAKLAE